MILEAEEQNLLHTIQFVLKKASARFYWARLAILGTHVSLPFLGNFANR